MTYSCSSCTNIIFLCLPVSSPPLSVSYSLSVYLSLSLSPSPSLSLSLCLYLSVSFCLSLSFSFSLCLSLFLSVPDGCHQLVKICSLSLLNTHLVPTLISLAERCQSLWEQQQLFSSSLVIREENFMQKQHLLNKVSG